MTELSLITYMPVRYLTQAQTTLIIHKLLFNSSLLIQINPFHCLLGKSMPATLSQK